MIDVLAAKSVLDIMASKDAIYLDQPFLCSSRSWELNAFILRQTWQRNRNYWAHVVLFKCALCQTFIQRLQTRSSWLNCALRDDEAVYWVSIGHYEAVAVGNWWYWVSRGYLCLYLLHKVKIWTGVTGALTHWLTDSLTTLKDRATQLLTKYKSGALVTEY